MLAGLKTEVAFLKECEKELKEHSRIDISYFELKRKVKKESEIEVKCIVVCAIESKAEELDAKLRRLISD